MPTKISILSLPVYTKHSQFLAIFAIEPDGCIIVSDTHRNMEKKNERIFISYKRVDKERVDALRKDIEQATGEPCWIDRDGIESDAQFVEVIMKAIDQCEVFLFMRSKEHNNITNYRTDWTIREVNYALEEKKRIIFISLDNTPLPRWFKFMFPQKQEIDALDATKLEHFYADLRSWLKVEEKKEEEEVREEKRKAETEKSAPMTRITMAPVKYYIGTLKGHTNDVMYASFSPDGSRIVSASWDRTVRIWDAATGECIRTLEGHTWVSGQPPSALTEAESSQHRRTKPSASGTQLQENASEHSKDIHGVSGQPPSALTEAESSQHRGTKPSASGTQLQENASEHSKDIQIMSPLPPSALTEAESCQHLWTRPSASGTQLQANASERSKDIQMKSALPPSALTGRESCLHLPTRPSASGTSPTFNLYHQHETQTISSLENLSATRPAGDGRGSNGSGLPC